MALDSMKEIFDRMEQEGKPFWEIVLETDMDERQVTRNQSMAKMLITWQAMADAADSYTGRRKSVSGLVGGDGMKMRQYCLRGEAMSGGYVSEVIAEALSMAESNACMCRIVAAPTAGACGVLPAVLLPLCGVINWSGIAKNTDWGVLLLFGGGITLSSILVQTGAAGFLADQVSSLAMGHSPIVILLIISLFITSLTEFCSNTASAALVAPLMVTVASAMGMSATPLVLLVGIGASCAFMLPVSTPPNALAFATGRFPQMTMVKVGLLINVVLVFVKAFWAWIFWM